MSPIVLLLIGMFVVIGGILALRMHAFLALTLAALIVAALTPQPNIYNVSIESAALKRLPAPADAPPDAIAVSFSASAGAAPGAPLLVMRHDGVQYKPIARLAVTKVGGSATWASVVEGAADFKLAADDLIVPPAAPAAASSAAKKNIGERLASGFGSTAASIGILIAMAAIIGKCLLDSGAANRIVGAALRGFGEKRAPMAFLSSGFVLGIPVFFDTVFYLMIPLGKALNVKTGRNYVLYVLTIVAGATMAHSLVPPTPGPLFVAEEIGKMMGPEKGGNMIGLMMIGGTIVGLFAALSGYAWAVWANRLWTVPLRDTPDMTVAELRQLAAVEESTLPPLWLSLTPILLPVILIAGDTVIDVAYKGVAADARPGWLVACGPMIEVLGNKNVALIVSAAIALFMLAWSKRASLKALSDAVGAALASAGVIILITAAGGAFGKILNETGIAATLREIPMSQAALIPLAWFVTAAVRTAQGSATVAMITAVGIIASMVSATDQLPFHPIYLALAIGCGSKPIAWMADSGFWVMCKMSGMTEVETLKTVSIMSVIMGVTGLIVTMIGAWLFPLV